MFRLITAFALLLGLSGSLCSQVCNYTFRKRIAFDPTKVSGSNDLTDFPVLIQVTDTDLRQAPTGHVQSASGFDIMFTSDDGATVLDHDLDSYNAATGALTVWVKIPVLSTSINTYIYMYYGNSAIVADQSSTATWSNGYVGVWHFDNNLNNSTPTAGLNGTNNGSTNTATSKFVSARQFVRASNQYVDVTPYNAAYDIVGDITVSCWVRMTSLGNDQKFAGNQNNVTGGWKFGIFSDNKIEFEIRTSGNNPFLSRSAAGGAALAVNTWYYVVGQYSDVGNFIRTYRNANLDRNYATTATMGTSNGTLKFGREPFQVNGAQLDGILDEMRISNVIRSADWIATEYENQNAPSTFYSIHPEPRVWDGSDNNQWTDPDNWSGNVVPASGEDVIIPNVGTDPVLNTSPDIGAMWIQTGGLFNNGANTRTISVAYDILNCGTYTGNNGHLRLNTSTIHVQHISGTGTYNLAKLIIDNQFFASPTTQLNRNVTVNQALTLLSGLVGTDATNILHLGNTATSTSGSQQCFIAGPMSKQGPANFVFPVGKGQEWRRIGISGLTTNTTFRAEYFVTPYTSTTPVTAPLDNVSVVEYWQLDRIAGTSNARVSLYWENVSSSGIDDCPDLTIARWNGASWVEHPATELAGSLCSGAGTGTITTNAVVTAFSPFTFGSTTAGLNALPLTIVKFEAVCDGLNVKLDWEDASPITSSKFIVEKTADGQLFSEVCTINAGPSDAGPAKYSCEDAARPGNTYYRVRQETKTGEIFYTPLVAAGCSEAASLGVYPNPNTGEFTVTGLQAGASLVVLNSVGQVVFETIAEQTTHTLSLKEKGFYLLHVRGSGAQSGLKVLVK